MSKIFLNAKYYFLYCILTYVVVVVALSSATTIIFTMLLSESIAAVLIAYWIAKMITRFIAIRSVYTPFVFIASQTIAMFFGVALSHENTGPRFTMWTCGCAFIVFIIVQTIMKKILIKRALVD